jgi:hypothetical protein
MKMNKKSILLGVILLVAVFLTTGCIFYNVLDKDDFKDHFTALGYTVTDTEVPKYDTGKTYLVATKEDVPYKVEYYEFDTEVNAKKVYEKYKKAIVEYITSDSKDQEVKGAVFSKTTSNSEKEYIVISRVKNTLIFIASTQDYKTEINNFLDEIKY